MSFPTLTLPNELLGAIFLELPPSALARAAAVSSLFKSVAERILYSSISIQDNLSIHSPTPSKTLRWCNSLFTRIDNVDVVRRVHIRWQAPSKDNTPPPQHLVAACELLGQAIQLLSHLESLELFLGPANLTCPHHSAAIHAVERVIAHCNLPRLEFCSLGADYAKGSAQPYTDVLTNFLARHSSLQHLKIPDLHSHIQLAVHSLPNLSSYRGSADAAASLLQGRPVQSLALFGDDSSVNRETLPRIASTSLPLRCLDLSGMSTRPMQLKNIAFFLPHLHVFRVRLALRHTLHYAFTGIRAVSDLPFFDASRREADDHFPPFQRLLAGLSTVLNSFTELEFLDLSPTDIAGVGRPDPREELALCREWQRGCPTLRRIIFPSQSVFVFQDSGAWLEVPTVPC